MTSEVLPTIRKTGGYVVTKHDDTPEMIMARAVMVAQDTIKRHDAVLRDVRNLLGQGVQAHNFVESHYE